MNDWFVEAPRDKENANSAVVFQLRDGKTMPDLIRTAEWLKFYTLLKEQERPIYTDSDCCCCVMSGRRHNVDPPKDYGYQLDLIIKEVKSEMVYKVQVSAPEASSAAVTLACWMRWLSLTGNSGHLDVTLKAFATQPRQALPRLDVIMPKVDGEPAPIIHCLRFHFCAVEDGVDLRGIPEVEFVQCTVDAEWQKLLATTSLQTLTISSTMPEFVKLSPAVGIGCGITKLNLLLHFWLQGDAMTCFCHAISENTALVKLTLQYLDVSDEGWMLLMQSLRNHPTLQSLSLAFTDNFVDNYRRLTPERRVQRTQAVLDLVRANSILHEVTWPEFQKNESLMLEIQAALKANRARE